MDDEHRKRVAVIYQPHSRAVQDTPKQSWGKDWVIKWEPTQSYKSPLMHWGSGTEDCHAYHEVKVRNLKDAINYAKVHGYGYDIMLPQQRYHLRKSYIDNFNWKGHPTKKEEVDDD